jgi:hypothetical protein
VFSRVVPSGISITCSARWLMCSGKGSVSRLATTPILHCRSAQRVMIAAPPDTGTPSKAVSTIMDTRCRPLNAIMNPMSVQLRKPIGSSRKKPQVTETWGFSSERFLAESVVTW